MKQTSLVHSSLNDVWNHMIQAMHGLINTQGRRKHTTNKLYVMFSIVPRDNLSELY